jgi:hypothetical protein
VTWLAQPTSRLRHQLLDGVKRCMGLSVNFHGTQDVTGDRLGPAVRCGYLWSHMAEKLATASPACTASDDVLILLFKTLATGFTASDIPHKAATARFIWFRNTLPAVCKRWHKLVLKTPAIWSHFIIDPSAESHYAKKNMHRAHEWERPTSPHGASGSSSPARGLSPALGSSPESDSSGYWTSQYAPYVPCAGGGRCLAVCMHLSSPCLNACTY